jgi:hypothetical protein
MNIKFLFMQDCVGSIDGTHMPMILPLEQQEPYRNRKQTFSQNVMLACDFDLKFVRYMPVGRDPLQMQEFYKMHLVMA